MYEAKRTPLLQKNRDGSPDKAKDESNVKNQSKLPETSVSQTINKDVEASGVIDKIIKTEKTEKAVKTATEKTEKT